MTRHETPNLSASVHQKLLNKARESGQSFNELLHYHAIERFLYRLSVSDYRSLFVLKGALMFQAWGVQEYRFTRDIDLLGHTSNAVEKIVAAFREICILEVAPDGWRFDPVSLQGERIKEQALYEGVRVTFTGWLGQARAAMQIDIGFGDALVSEASAIAYPALLKFPAPVLHGYSRESLIAEKFQAMIALGELNSRMKDFYDIDTLARKFNFDGSSLQQAIEKTFDQRATRLPTETPVAFTPEFVLQKRALWSIFLHRVQPGLPEKDFARVVARLEQFLMPVSRASNAGQVFQKSWLKSQGLWFGDGD